MISNSSGEVFSKLKLIKDAHRSTMRQNRRVRLTMLSTEWDIMRRINLDNILSDFSVVKRANNSLAFE